MKDTQPEIEQKFFKMLMEKSGEERLRMGFEMNAMSRRLATASIIQEIPGASEEDVKVALLYRVYGGDLLPEIRKKIIEKIKEKRGQV